MSYFWSRPDFVSVGASMSAFYQNSALKERASGFDTLFSQIAGKSEMSVEELFSGAFPDYTVIVRFVDAVVSEENFYRNDFPFWAYFTDGLDTEDPDDRMPEGTGFSESDAGLQGRLWEIGYRKLAVIMPEALRRKTEREPDDRVQIVKKVSAWKEHYDRTDNAAAAVRGYDPVQYQRSKSYCLWLDKDGNVVRAVVVSGGMWENEAAAFSGTEEQESGKSRESGLAGETVLRLVSKIVGQNAEYLPADYYHINAEDPNLLGILAAACYQDEEKSRKSADRLRISRKRRRSDRRFVHYVFGK